MNEHEVTIIDAEGVHAGTVSGNTLTRTGKAPDWSSFTQGKNGRNWIGQYPYTAIAYRYGKRIYPEFTNAGDLMEHIENNEAYSVSVVITPNGFMWKAKDFAEQYSKIIGLIVEVPDAE